MICKVCGHQNESEALFCASCGAKLEEEQKQETSEEIINEEPVVEEETSEEIINEEPVVEEETTQDPIIEKEETEEQSSEEKEEEILSHYPSDIFSNEFEYTKKIFNRYYRQEFKSRSLGAYIALQILTLMSFTFPGILFALIYWLVSNPITKSSLWKEVLYENKGNLPIYKFFFKDEELVVRRNRTEECTMKYDQFKKIIMNKNGIVFLSKQRDFYLPIEEVKNVDELKEILKKFKNCKVK